MPVIAAAGGVAAGAGASLAFACDLRVAARRADVLMAFRTGRARGRLRGVLAFANKQQPAYQGR